MGTIFIAGTYGVGKSTLALKLSKKTGIPFYSAGDLISARTGKQYGKNKAVSNKDRNQDILIDIISGILLGVERIFLAGHFCIATKDRQVDLLPENVFTKLDIDKIILLESSVNIISDHLKNRDNKHYPLDLLQHLQQEERMAAKRTSKRLSCPLLIHTMEYTDSEINDLIYFLNT